MLPLYDSNPSGRTPWITLLLIAANLVAFVWSINLPPREQIDLIVHRGFIPKRIEQLTDPKLVVRVDVSNPDHPIPELQNLQPVALRANPAEILLSFVTMMFLHGNWAHILGNMWFLWIFGNNVEDRLGHFLFGLFYFVGGWLALACQWAFSPESSVPAIGASGAVAAVLGGYAIAFPHAKVKTLVFIVVIITIVDLPALVVLGLWLLGQILNGIGAIGLEMDGGVAWWAHIGGFFAGLVLMPLLTLGAEDSKVDLWEDWLQRPPAQY
jgi:membrane associated rhomboid family serine protease